jgi:hypothetical protein
MFLADFLWGVRISKAKFSRLLVFRAACVLIAYPLQRLVVSVPRPSGHSKMGTT